LKIGVNARSKVIDVANNTAELGLALKTELMAEQMRPITTVNKVMSEDAAKNKAMSGDVSGSLDVDILKVKANKANKVLSMLSTKLDIILPPIMDH